MPSNGSGMCSTNVPCPQAVCTDFSAHTSTAAATCRLYVAPLYLIMELLPEILVLVVTLRRDVSTQVVRRARRFEHQHRYAGTNASGGVHSFPSKHHCEVGSRNRTNE